MKPISEMAITFSTAGTLLGIIIDSELKFENHLNSICNKVSRKINVLGRVINNWVNVELRRKYSTNFNLITVLFYECCARKISSIKLIVSMKESQELLILTIQHPLSAFLITAILFNSRKKYSKFSYRNLQICKWIISRYSE